MSKCDWDQVVSHTAATMISAGTKVTAEAVRRQIGHGSLRDICPALRRWRDTRPQSGNVVEALPPEVAKAFQAAGASAWALAERMATERIRAIESVCGRRASEAEDERDDALMSLTRLEEQLDLMRDDLCVARASAMQATAALARIEAESVADRSKIVWLVESVASEKQATADARALVTELRQRLAAERNDCRSTALGVG